MTAVLIRTALIYLILNLLLKIMGKRQIGELEVSELVSTLLISELASIPISEPDIPFLYALIPILFIGGVEIALSALKNKSNRAKRMLEGRFCYVIHKGRILQDALIKNRISINEILTEMQIQGISNPKDVYYAILEQNGKLAFFKRSDSLAHPLILDGELIGENLSTLNVSSSDVERRIASLGAKKESVFLMTLTDSNDINIIIKEENK